MKSLKKILSTRMSNWRCQTTEGAEFWITCKQLAFLLSSFSHLQVIQNKRPRCSAAAYVTTGLNQENMMKIGLHSNLVSFWNWIFADSQQMALSSQISDFFPIFIVQFSFSNLSSSSRHVFTSPVFRVSKGLKTNCSGINYWNCNSGSLMQFTYILFLNSFSCLSTFFGTDCKQITIGSLYANKFHPGWAFFTKKKYTGFSSLFSFQGHVM